MDMISPSHAEQHRRHVERQKRLWANPSTEDATKPVSEPVRLFNPLPTEIEKLKVKLCRAETEISSYRETVSRKDREISRLERELDAMMQKVTKQAKLIEQTHHEEMYGNFVVKKHPNDIINETLEQFPGVSFDEVRGYQQSKYTVEARHACVMEVRLQRPDLSSAEMGRVFNRDHSTILTTVRKMRWKYAT